MCAVAARYLEKHMAVPKLRPGPPVIPRRQPVMQPVHITFFFSLARPWNWLGCARSVRGMQANKGKGYGVFTAVCQVKKNRSSFMIAGQKRIKSGSTVARISSSPGTQPSSLEGRQGEHSARISASPGTRTLHLKVARNCCAEEARGKPCPSGSAALPGRSASTTCQPAAAAACASLILSVAKSSSEGLSTPSDSAMLR